MSLIGVNEQTMGLIRDRRLVWATQPARAAPWSLVGAVSAGKIEFAECRMEVFGDDPNSIDQFGRPAYRIDGNYIREGMYGRPKYYRHIRWRV